MSYVERVVACFWTKFNHQCIPALLRLQLIVVQAQLLALAAPFQYCARSLRHESPSPTFTYKPSYPRRNQVHQHMALPIR